MISIIILITSITIIVIATKININVLKTIIRISIIISIMIMGPVLLLAFPLTLSQQNAISGAHKLQNPVAFVSSSVFGAFLKALGPRKMSVSAFCKLFDENVTEC